MIELENVSKEYRTSKGKVTKALKNVSLSFEEKGMTFILGKSGSGKSTLLNIIGGLDKYDFGNITILGKSSKDFSKVDFDSYRNTYIGFVFQEYNLLDDYNVYQNISLALQLQKKKVVKEEIEKLLEKLELKELEFRNINELSGGQKQRVAIARALVKNPKIILADEPTGNLDSETGIQVMNLLKEISKDKLVIIVSHDTEIAHLYGDRIIEIKDGTIIHDTLEKNINHHTYSYKPIRSNLPFKDSFILGIGSLKHKKIKLFFTIFLIVCSLLFLGLLDTLSSYDVDLAHSKLLTDRKEQFVQVEKAIVTQEPDGYILKDVENLTNSDIKYIKSKIKQKSFLVYQFKERWKDIVDIFHFVNGDHYGDKLEMVVDDQFEYLSHVPLIGKVPTSSHEVVISSYIAELMIRKGVQLSNSGDFFQPKNYDDILNMESLPFGDNASIKISGIIDYPVDRDFEFQARDDKKNTNYTVEELRERKDYKRKEENVYNKIYVSSDFISYLNETSDAVFDTSVDFKFQNELSLITTGPMIVPEVVSKDKEYYDGEKWISKDDLNDNEIVLNVSQLEYFNIADYRSKLTPYINRNLAEDQLDLEKKFFADYVKDYSIIGSTIHLTIQDKSEAKEKEYALKVVGLTGLVTNNEEHYYLPSSILDKYIIKDFPVTSIFIVEDKEKEFKSLLDEFDMTDKYSLRTTYYDDVLESIQTVYSYKRLSLYLSIAFLLFTIILISNFIVSSISYRKKEIGILRGLGATNRDVIKIFLWEGIVLATISFVFTSILLVVVSRLLNIECVNSGLDLILSPFILTSRQFIVIFIFVYLIVFISSIIPISKISKMRPIDAILNR